MQIVTLNLTPGSVAPVVYASQNDDGRLIRFMLVDGDINNSYSLNGLETITAKLTKPDGTETTIAVTNPGSGKNYVDLVNGLSDYDQEGVYLGEVVLTRNATVLGTGNFILEVEADAYGSDVEVRSASGIIASFETALSEPLVSLKCNFLCSGGNGTPSTPIPLVPFTELNVTRTGVNVWDEEWEVGSINNSTGVLEPGNLVRCKNPIFVEGSKTYYFKCATGTSMNGTLFFYDVSGNFISLTYSQNSTFNTPATARYMRFKIGSAYGTTYNNDISVNSISTDTEYHAYNGQTITLDLDGTRYGGYVDANNGKLVVTHIGITRTWGDFGNKATLTNNTRGSLNITSEGMGIDNNTSDLCNVAPYQYSWAGDTNHFYIQISGDNTYLYVFLPNGTSDDTVIQVAYELATPIEVDITPAFLSAIQGQNNVFHDGNGTVELEYLDLKE